MFKNEGFKIVKEKKIKLEKIDAEKFYKVHETKPFYNDLCEDLSSGPIVVMILEKNGAVLDNRRLMALLIQKMQKMEQLEKNLVYL